MRILDDRLAGKWMPRRAKDGDAGIDLRCMLSEDINIWPGEIWRVPTGIAIHIGDPGYCGLVMPRSGMAFDGLTVANAPGLIDSGYQGSLDVLLISHRREGPIRLHVGDRIAQLVIVPVSTPALVVVDQFAAPTERGDSGFGSTGAQ